MKKTLLKLLFLALPLAAVTVSCDKDDFNADDLVGTWDLTYWESVKTENGKITDEDSGTVTPGDTAIRFNKDRSFEQQDTNGAWQKAGVWSISGSYLTIDDGKGNARKRHIDILTSNKLVLSISSKTVTDGVTYVESGSSTYTKR